MSLNNLPYCYKICFLIAILCLGFLTFSTCINNEFVNIDDPAYILDNPTIKELNIINFKDFFCSYKVSTYAPLPLLTFALEYNFFKTNPTPYHFNNVLLHLFNIGLVFWFIYLLCGNFGTAALVSILFGVHPLRVESVAWISERKDLLFAFFYLASMVSYLYFLKQSVRRQWFLAFTFILFVLSCLSKSQAISIVMLMLLIDYFYRKESFREMVREKIPFILVSIIFLVINLLAMKEKLGDPRSGGVEFFSFFEKLLLTNYALLLYLFKSIVPFKLSLIYSYPAKSDHFLWLIVYLSPLVNILLAMFIIKLSRISNEIGFGFLFFMATISLPLGVMWSEGVFMHDRYTYLPHIGLFFALVCLIQNLNFPKKLYLKQYAILVFGLFMALSAYNRGSVWKDSVSLWSDVIAQYPKTALAYYSRGSALGNMRRVQEAVADFNKAIQISPDYPIAYVNRGIGLSQMNRKDLALKDFDQAVLLDAKLSIAYYHRGNLYSSLENYTEAIKNYNKAIELNGSFIRAYNSRGILEAKAGRYGLALDDFNKAITLDPQLLDPYSNRGNLFRLLGNGDLALADFNKVIKIDPDNKLALAQIDFLSKFFENPTNERAVSSQ